MSQIDYFGAPIEALQQEMGKALDEAIDKQGGKVAFVKRAGLNRATLYRLLRGENVSTDVLLRTLRALGRRDLIAQLIASPEPSPLELRPALKKRRSLEKSRSLKNQGTELSPAPPSPIATPSPITTHSAHAKKRSLVSQLALGRLAKESDDA